MPPLDPHAKRDSRAGSLASVFGLRDAGRVLRDFATYLPSQAVPAVAGFLVLPVLARKLFPTELGVLAIAQTLVTLGWTIIGSWLVAALIRELPVHRARGDVRAFAHTLVQGLGLVALGLAVFAALLAGASTFSSTLATTYPYVVAATGGLVLQNIAVSLFAASLRPKAYAAIELTARVGGIGLGVALVFAGHRVTGYLAGLAAASLAIGAVGLVLAWPRNEPGTSSDEKPTRELRSWLNYGIPASLALVAVWLLAFVDRYLLAIYKDTAAVGIYTVGNVLGDRIVMVPMAAFVTAALPLLITAFERMGRSEVERLLAAYTRIVLLVGVPCIVFITVAGADLVKVISGLRYDDYKGAATVAPIVAVGSLLFALTTLANVGLAVARQMRYLVASAGIAVVVNVLANLVLIPPYGAIGAAVATPISTGAYLVITYYWARRYAKWRFPRATLARAIAAGLLAYVAVVTIVPDSWSRVNKIGLTALLGGAVYAAVVVLLGERKSSRHDVLPSSSS